MLRLLIERKVGEVDSRAKFHGTGAVRVVDESANEVRAGLIIFESPATLSGLAVILRFASSRGIEVKVPYFVEIKDGYIVGS